ncbi:ANK2 [Symbiodinium sp. CCMP2592]|nr:ANK2 [Symbiodinium sp. CCMP2592]
MDNLISDSNGLLVAKVYRLLHRGLWTRCNCLYGAEVHPGEPPRALTGIDAKTIFYPDKDTSGALERESKRFKSVKSASNLLAPASSSAKHAKPEHEVHEHEQAGHDSFPSTANKEEALKKEDEAVCVKLEKDEDERTFGAFKKQLGNRVLHLNKLMPPKEKFNPFPPPKTSVRRMIAKRPSAMKSAIWNEIPYVKDNNGGHVHLEKAKWRRTIQEFLSASNEKIIEILTANGILPNWKGCVCPHCQSGKLGPLTSNGRDDILRYRCNKKCCQLFFSLTPILHGNERARGSLASSAGCSPSSSSPQCSAVQHPLAHTHQSQSPEFGRGVLFMRKGYVQKAEKEIKFCGCPRAWKELEADKATFDKKTLSPQELGAKPVLWEQWGAIVRRGTPETLVLTKLNPAMTVPRAARPGAIRKVDWKPLALKHVPNRNVILHTDSARSYNFETVRCCARCGGAQEEPCREERKVGVVEADLRSHLEAQVA